MHVVVGTVREVEYQILQIKMPSVVQRDTSTPPCVQAVRPALRQVRGAGTDLRHRGRRRVTGRRADRLERACCVVMAGEGPSLPLSTPLQRAAAPPLATGAPQRDGAVTPLPAGAT